MPIHKRSDSPYYYIQFEINGHRVRQSSKTPNRQEAEQLELKLKQEYWDNKKLNKPLKYTWKEAVVKYVEEKQHKKSLEFDILMFNILSPYLREKLLTEIDRELMEHVAHSLKRTRSLTDSRINRYMSLVRGVLNLAHREWGWLNLPTTLRFRPEQQKRVRWITKAEAAKLIKEAPTHLKGPIRFSLATGLRKKNVFGLTWDQLDLARKTAWVYGDEAKGKKDIPIPLNRAAMNAIPKERTHKNVFTFQGRPFKPDRQSWINLCSRAGIENFRWHDLRHTWASHHVMSGTSLNELMELGGWSSIKMVLKYAHLSSDHLKNAANNIEDLFDEES